MSAQSYFVGTVYGSLTTAIAVLLSLELAAVLLLGAQVISEYECVGTPYERAPLRPFTTGD